MAKKQTTIAQPNAEATEIEWITYFIQYIGLFLPTPPVLFYDNLSALQMTVNPFFHIWTKHIEINYHFVREKVTLCTLISFMSLPQIKLLIFSQSLTETSPSIHEELAWHIVCTILLQLWGVYGPGLGRAEAYPGSALLPASNTYVQAQPKPESGLEWLDQVRPL